MSTMKCLYTNIQSLVNKKTELMNLLISNDVQLVFLTETWLTQQHAKSEYHLNGYQEPIVHFRDKGGSAIYVRDSIDFNEVEVPEKCSDSTWISIRTENKRRRIYGCIYRSPNSAASNNEHLMKNMMWASTNYDEVVIVGDINLPSVRWEADEASGVFPREFLSATSDLNLEQLVTENTRFRHGQFPSLLDLILTDQPDIVQNIEYLPPIGKSDHVTIQFNVKNVFARKHKPARLNHRRINKDDFRTILRAEDWDEVFSTRHDFLDAYSNFNDTVVNGIIGCTPKSRSQNQARSPWINKTIRKLATEKNAKNSRQILLRKVSKSHLETSLKRICF